MRMNTKQLTLDDIRKAIAETSMYEIGEDVARMTDEAFAQCYLEDDLGIDSLDLMELTMQLERNHNLSIPDDAEERVFKHGTVADILAEYNKYVA